MRGSDADALAQAQAKSPSADALILEGAVAPEEGERERMGAIDQGRCRRAPRTGKRESEVAQKSF
jgi:hypothetical protein